MQRHEQVDDSLGSATEPPGTGPLGGAEPGALLTGRPERSGSAAPRGPGTSRSSRLLPCRLGCPAGGAVLLPVRHLTAAAAGPANGWADEEQHGLVGVIKPYGLLKLLLSASGWGGRCP